MEERLVTDPAFEDAAYYYATQLIKNVKNRKSTPLSWIKYEREKYVGSPEKEKAIVSDPYYAYHYAVDVIRGPWPEGEKAIASNPEYAYRYAQDVIQGPWPEGEKAIASDPKYAFYYARDVIQGPWPEGEKAIASDYWQADAYARDIIKYRNSRAWGKRYLAGKIK